MKYRIDSCKDRTPNLATQNFEEKERKFHRRSNRVWCPDAVHTHGKFLRAAHFRVPLLDGESYALTSNALVHLGIRCVQ